MPLFQVAIIENPTKKEKEEGGQDKLVMEPTNIVAKNEQNAVVKAVAMASENGGLKLDADRMEVIARPF